MCGVWARDLDDREEKMLMAFVAWCWRRMVKISCMKNATYIKQTQIQDHILNTSRQQRIEINRAVN